MLVTLSTHTLLRESSRIRRIGLSRRHSTYFKPPHSVMQVEPPPKRLTGGCLTALRHYDLCVTTNCSNPLSYLTSLSLQPPLQKLSPRHSFDFAQYSQKRAAADILLVERLGANHSDPTRTSCLTPLSVRSSFQRP